MSSTQRAVRCAFALVLVAAAVASAPDAAWAQRPTFDPEATYRVPLGDSPRRGPDDAPITVVELSDFACRYCNRAQHTLTQLEALYPGKIRRVYRQTPLDLADGSLAAEAALAAHAQGQFWPMHDALFAVRGRVDRAAVESLADVLGLDLARFRADLDERRHLPAVHRDAGDAQALGVFSTPWFFINGRAVRGAQPLAVMRRIVDEELARADELIAGGVAPAGLYEHLMLSARARGESGGPEEDYGDPALDLNAVYRLGMGEPGHRRGPDDALVTIVEFSDFECPFCARNAPVLARLLREHPDDVRLVFRHSPLSFHAHAQLAAEASMAAAAQGKFWEYHEALFADVEHLERADLEQRAATLGLDLAAFRAALDDRRYRDVVAADAAAAAALGVSGTPTMFINGQPIEGSAPYEQLAALIGEKRAEAERLISVGVARGDVYGLLMDRAERGEGGDPSKFPALASVDDLALGQGDLALAVHAACRAREDERARALAKKLGAGRAAVAADCAVYGIDLP
jgi:protein-disulfide isomerase